jgi:hypothetical protein
MLSLFQLPDPLLTKRNSLPHCCTVLSLNITFEVQYAPKHYKQFAFLYVSLKQTVLIECGKCCFVKCTIGKVL